MTSKPLLYLAVPYSHPDAVVREYRFQQANKAAAFLMKKGVHVFSPISHTHPIALAGELPLGWDFWESYDRAFLSHCHTLTVLTLEGWKISKGVIAEMQIAHEFGINVNYMEPLP